jgi:hypothetical protein
MLRGAFTDITCAAMMPPRLRPRRAAPISALALAVALGGASARAEPPRSLSRLEQESVDQALSGLGLMIEPHPEGKSVGAIYVVNQDVFSPRDWYFQLLNIFHRTTRPDVLRRELLFKPGQPYDAALIEESMRNLQTPPTVTLATGTRLSPPELSSVVAIVPVASRQPGTVDVLAVTRDVWSLRLNTNFELQQNTLSLLETSLSENNLFGWRKFFSVGFTLDLGKYGIGPTYFDPNILGTRLQLYANAIGFYTRGANTYEGNYETLSFAYPLYSLASRWGAGIAVSHEDEVFRAFTGTSLTRVPLMSEAVCVVVCANDSVLVPLIYRRRFVIVDAGGTRSFGAAVIQRVKLGYRFDDRRSLAVQGFDYGVTPAQVQEFVTEYAPLTERRSEPYVSYSVFTARYGVYRDLDTFDLRENSQLGPSASVVAAYGAPALGADFRAVPLSAAASWTWGPGNALARASFAGGLRVLEGQAIDETVEGKLYFASPPLKRALRAVASVQADVARNDTQHTRYALGGDTGMRGYIIGEFQGSSAAIGHLELRSAPLAIFSQRVGGLLFCDAGDAATSLYTLTLRADVGVGLRWLIPQLNSYVIRVDWAVPLVDGIETRAGLPGRVSAGMAQIF